MDIDEENLDKLKRQLLSMKQELLQQEQDFKENAKPVELDQSKVGRLSRMDAMQAQQMALEVSRRRQRQLLKVDGALTRMESGSYGFCYICDEEIDIRRLFVDPTHTRCVICANK